ncbi:ABC transporter ATP-binding protein [Streptomyces sp. NPDC058330]|uniref:ABC transporter ATP-binding protein n=1 Tax=Streptomyces sp. NPDC058330 TaxID=3346449 RepID=UPI0036E98956
MSAVIEVHHLHKKYGDVVAVDDMSFTVEEGEIFGIVGPEGAGKTTALECIKGLRNRDGGEIRVLGRDPRTERAEITRRLDEQLRSSRGAEDRTRIAEALSLYSSFYRGPDDWRRLMESLGLTDRPGPMSEEERLSVALTRAGNPQVAVFDELTTGLDPQDRSATWELIEMVRDSGVTILLATPDRAEAERLCDRITLIDPPRIRPCPLPGQPVRAEWAARTPRSD